MSTRWLFFSEDRLDDDNLLKQIEFVSADFGDFYNFNFQWQRFSRQELLDLLNIYHFIYDVNKQPDETVTPKLIEKQLQQSCLGSNNDISSIDSLKQAALLHYLGRFYRQLSPPKYDLAMNAAWQAWEKGNLCAGLECLLQLTKLSAQAQQNFKDNLQSKGFSESDITLDPIYPKTEKTTFLLIKQWFAESFSALALEVQLDNILLLLNMDTLFQAISVAPEILVENLSLLNKAELSTLKKLNTQDLDELYYYLILLTYCRKIALIFPALRKQKITEKEIPIIKEFFELVSLDRQSEVVLNEIAACMNDFQANMSLLLSLSQFDGIDLLLSGPLFAKFNRQRDGVSSLMTILSVFLTAFTETPLRLHSPEVLWEKKAKAAANQFLIMRQNLLEFINQYYSLNQIQQNYWRDVICQVQKPWQRFILQQATRQLDVVIIQVAKCQIAIAQFDLSEICTSLLAIHNIVEQDPQKIQRFSTSLDQIDNAQLMLFVQSFLAEMKEYKDSIEDILFLIKKGLPNLGEKNYRNCLEKMALNGVIKVAKRMQTINWPQLERFAFVLAARKPKTYNFDHFSNPKSKYAKKYRPPLSKPAHFINLISAMEVFAVMPLPVDVNLNGNNIGNMLDFFCQAVVADSLIENVCDHLLDVEYNLVQEKLNQLIQLLQQLNECLEPNNVWGIISILKIQTISILMTNFNVSFVRLCLYIDRYGLDEFMAKIDTDIVNYRTDEQLTMIIKITTEFSLKRKRMPDTEFETDEQEQSEQEFSTQEGDDQEFVA